MTYAEFIASEPKNKSVRMSRDAFAQMFPEAHPRSLEASVTLVGGYLHIDVDEALDGDWVLILE